MAYEMKDGQGSLFKNDKKESERHPDYKGRIMIDGTEYQLAAWIKEGQKGKFMSLSAQLPREGRDEQRPTKPNPPSRRDPLDDDLPF